MGKVLHLDQAEHHTEAREAHPRSRRSCKRSLEYVRESLRRWEHCACPPGSTGEPNSMLSMSIRTYRTFIPTSVPRQVYNNKHSAQDTVKGVMTRFPIARLE